MLCDNRNAGLDDACKTRAEILGTDPIIETIEVTRMNKGGIELSVFDRYERHRRDLDTSYFYWETFPQWRKHSYAQGYSYGALPHH